MDVENKCMDTKGKREVGMNWKIGVDTYTLLILCIKEISKRTYCTAQRTLLSALWWLKWEGNPKRGNICIHIADPLCCTVETNTMLYYFLLCSKVNQLYVYIYSLFFRFVSHLSHHRGQRRVPCARFSLVVYFMHSINSVYMSIPISQFIPPHPPFLLGIHTSVFSIYVTISALQIR